MSVYCEYCGVEIKGKRAAARFCSRACANRANRAKADQTIMERYGVSNPSLMDNFSERRRATCLERYGAEHPMHSEEVKERIKQTSIDRYGVTHPSKTQAVKDKKKSTCLERYGVEYPAQAESVQVKMQLTSMERYGVENSSKLESVKRKIKETNLKRYGAEYHQQTEEGMDNIRRSFLDRYGVDNPSRLESVRVAISEKNNRWNLDLQQIIQMNKELSIPQIADRVGCSRALIYQLLWKNEVQFNRFPYTSFPQMKVVEFLKQHQINCVVNDRTKLKPKELDIFLPEHSMAIEVNGLYWHSEVSGGKSKNYHLDKSKECKAAGIQLLHFTDVEILTKFHIICSMLLVKLGMVKTKISARTCSVGQCSSEEAKQFLNENHIQGYHPGSSHWKLTNREGTVVAVASFAKARFSRSSDSYELLRFASLRDHLVVGGFQKLIKSSGIHGTIISYSMNNYSDGKVYEKSGWKLLSENSPGYHYTMDYVELFNRMKFQKHKLEKVLETFNSELTEWENMRANGWDRIWDSGTKTWVLEL